MSEQGLPRIDQATADSWLYPSNWDVRPYQFDIVATALRENTLVCLPTGLGKTLIAATVLYNFYRWFPQGMGVFLAPTKPLVAQQLKACCEIVSMDLSDVAHLEGSVSAEERCGLWKSKRLFFCTPQTMAHDLESGLVDSRRLVCLVLDEAHRASGSYAYVTIVDKVWEANSSFRLLALSATPASTFSKVQSLIRTLKIAQIEIRTEEDKDLEPYLFDKQIDFLKFKSSSHAECLQKLVDQTNAMIQPFLNKLCDKRILNSKMTKNLNILVIDEAMRVSHPADISNSLNILKFLLECRRILSANMSDYTAAVIGNVIQSLQSFISDRIMALPYYCQQLQEFIRASPAFKSFSHELGQVSKNSQFLTVLQPKLDLLNSVLLEHFQRRQGSTRVIIFSEKRATVQTIVQSIVELGENTIRPHIFIGQTTAKSSEGEEKPGVPGLKQKEQKRVLDMFSAGQVNVLASTSIAEEGLDIVDVDLIVIFDTIASPGRLVQRMGRCGRKRHGRVVMLLEEGKDDVKLEQTHKSLKEIQSLLRDPSKKLKLSENLRQLFPAELPPPIPQLHEFNITSFDGSRIHGSKWHSADGESSKSKPKKSKSIIESLQAATTAPSTAVDTANDSDCICGFQMNESIAAKGIFLGDEARTKASSKGTVKATFPLLSSVRPQREQQSQRISVDLVDSEDEVVFSIAASSPALSSESLCGNSSVPSLPMDLATPNDVSLAFELASPTPPLRSLGSSPRLSLEEVEALQRQHREPFVATRLKVYESPSYSSLRTKLHLSSNQHWQTPLSRFREKKLTITEHFDLSEFLASPCFPSQPQPVSQLTAMVVAAGESVSSNAPSDCSVSKPIELDVTTSANTSSESLGSSIRKVLHLHSANKSGFILPSDDSDSGSDLGSSQVSASGVSDVQRAQDSPWRNESLASSPWHEEGVLHMDQWTEIRPEKAKEMEMSPPSYVEYGDPQRLTVRFEEEEVWDSPAMPPSLRQQQGVTVEEAEDESDEDILCCVCLSGHSSEENPVLFCEGSCHQAVHAECFGLRQLPGEEEPFYCDGCAHRRTRDEYSMQAVRCSLCSRPFGLMRKELSGRGFVHLCCVLFTPELTISSQSMQANNLSALDKERRTLFCGICRGQGGATVQCAYPSCLDMIAHPFCVMKQLYYWPTHRYSDTSRSWSLAIRPCSAVDSEATMAYELYCGRHSSRLLSEDYLTICNESTFSVLFTAGIVGSSPVQYETPVMGSDGVRTPQMSRKVSVGSNNSSMQWEESPDLPTLGKRCKRLKRCNGGTVTLSLKSAAVTAAEREGKKSGKRFKIAERYFENEAQLSGSEVGSSDGEDDEEEEGSQLSGDFINDSAYTQHSDSPGMSLYLNADRLHAEENSPDYNQYYSDSPNIAAIDRLLPRFRGTERGLPITARLLRKEYKRQKTTGSSKPKGDKSTRTNFQDLTESPVVHSANRSFQLPSDSSDSASDSESSEDEPFESMKESRVNLLSSSSCSSSSNDSEDIHVNRLESLVQPRRGIAEPSVDLQPYSDWNVDSFVEEEW